jgi:hypothetical protein
MTDGVLDTGELVVEVVTIFTLHTSATLDQEFTKGDDVLGETLL